jgi:hypothetical protein
MTTATIPPAVYEARSSPRSTLANIQPSPPLSTLPLLEIASIKINIAAEKTIIDVKVIVLEYCPKIFLPFVKNITVVNKTHEITINTIEAIAGSEILITKVLPTWYSKVQKPSVMSKPSIDTLVPSPQIVTSRNVVKESIQVPIAKHLKMVVLLLVDRG